jgi:hypothetical protein
VRTLYLFCVQESELFTAEAQRAPESQSLKSEFSVNPVSLGC